MHCLWLDHWRFSHSWRCVGLPIHHFISALHWRIITCDDICEQVWFVFQPFRAETASVSVTLLSLSEFFSSNNSSYKICITAFLFIIRLLGHRYSRAIALIIWTFPSVLTVTCQPVVHHVQPLSDDQKIVCAVQKHAQVTSLSPNTPSQISKRFLLRITY